MRINTLYVNTKCGINTVYDNKMLDNMVKFSDQLNSHIFVSFCRSADYPGKICDQQELLQQWLLTLPTTLLEDVIEKV